MKHTRLITCFLTLLILVSINLPLTHASEDADDPAYLAETPECQFTPELKELAKQLEYNPVKIYNWVYENIEYEDYSRSRKGAYGVYLAKQGNAWDQASFLITLLRISGIPVRYVYKEQGYDNGPFVHVEAWISINSYRGNGDNVEKIWVPLATWPKDYHIDNGIDLFPNGVVSEELNFDFNAYLSSVKQKSALELYEDKVQHYLNAHYPGKSLKDVLYRKNIIKKPLSIIPTALPAGYRNYPGVNTSAEIRENDRDSIVLDFHNAFASNTGLILSSGKLYLSQLAGKRFCLDFIPASEADAKVISNFGGVAKTPYHYAKLKPVLRLDGKIIREGTPVYTGDSVSYSDGWGRDRIWRVGTYIQIGCDAASASEITIQKAKVELKNISADVVLNLGTREEYLGRIGQILMTTYLLREKETAERLSELLHCEPIPYPWAIKFAFISPEEMANDRETKFLIHPNWTFDAHSNYAGVRKNQISYNLKTPFGLLVENFIMHNGSYDEGRIFEDWQDTPGANTVKGIMLANEQGIRVVTLTKADLVNGHLSILENETVDRYDSWIIAAIIELLEKGNTVTVPVRRVRYGDMMLSVYKYIGESGGWGMMFGNNLGGANSSKVTVNASIATLPTTMPPAQTKSVTDSQNKANNGQTNKQEAKKSVDGDPVDLVIGEFEHEEKPDFDIKSRGVKLDILRKYKSQLIYNGPFGYGWAWNHSEGLLVGTNGDLIFYNSERVPYYLTVNSDGTYKYPAGATFIIKKEVSQYVLTEKDQNKIYFSDQGRLIKKEDTNGNALTFEYGAQGQMIKIIDPLGRNLSLTYNASGKISQISDFQGGSCSYDYDGDDLIRFTDLEGNTYSYEYLKGQESNPAYSTKLLLQADGVNGSTNFIDNAGHSITTNGNAQISTATSKFGGSSAYFDGSGDYLTVPDSTDWNFGTADFTIDTWVRIADNTNSAYILGARDDATHAIEFYISPQGAVLFGWVNGAAVGIVNTNVGVIQINTWHHLAAVRQNNVMKIYVDGVDKTFSDTTSTKAMSDLAGNLFVGAMSATDVNKLNGWLDELRISKGIARWSANFTPPTEPDATNFTPATDPTKLLLYCDDTGAFNEFTDTMEHVVMPLGNARIDIIQSKFGNASVVFDGDVDRLDFDASEDLNLSSGDFTIDFWVRFKSLTLPNGLFWQRETTLNMDNLIECHTMPDGSIIFSVGVSDKQTIVLVAPPSTVAINTWQHIAIVHSGNNYILYVDGLVKASLTNSNNPANYKDRFEIGWATTGESSMYSFNGWLDEFRISKGIARWTSNFTPPTQAYSPDSYTKLLLHCDYDDAYTKFTDNQGHSVTPNGNVRPDIIQKKYGAASAKFDGNGDYLTLPDSDDWNFGTADFTIDTWVRIADNTNSAYILGARDDATHAIEFYISSQGAVLFGWTNGAAVGIAHTNIGAIQIHTWHHLAAVRQNNVMKIYVDGVDKTISDTTSTKAIPDLSGNLFIGAMSATDVNKLNGWLDELRITKGVARWTSNFTPPTQQFNFSQDIPKGNIEQENPANVHNMSKYTLPNGDYLDIGYYKNDTVAFHRNKKDEVFSFQYSRLNRYAETWNEEGYYRKVFYNDMNDVIRVTTREKNVELKSYDTKHNMTSFTDANGYTTTFTYDANRNLTSKTDALNQTWRYTYDTTFNKPTSIIDPNGNITTMEYDSRGNLTKITDAQGGITAYVYDAYGNLLKVTDAKGAFQETTYDSQGVNPVQIKDKNKNQTDYSYDNIGNLISETDPLSNTTRYEYNKYNQKTKITDALDNITRYEYDSNRFLTKLIEPNGAITQNIYDTVRDMVSGAKILQTIDPLEKKESYTYDKLGNMISRTDKNENTTLFAYDAMNRLIETTDPFQNTIRNAYDGNGNLVSVTDKRGNATKFTYDAANRKTALIDPYENKTKYEYDKNGNLIKEINAAGVVVKYDYDKLNRLVKKTVGDGLTNPRIFIFEYDTLGQLVKNTDSLGNYTVFEYDANGNKTKETFFDSAQKKLSEISYFYDARNLLIKKIDPNGNAWQFEYDKLKRKITEIDPLGNKVEYAYDKVGNIRAIKDQLQNITAFTYNKRKEKIIETNPYADTKQFTYDDNGNLITVTDELGNITQYGYDSLNRKIAETNALGATTTFDYDANSNLISKVLPSGYYKYIHAYDANNRLIQQAYFYWDTSHPLSFEYDSLGRLIRTKDARNAETLTAYNEFNEIAAITNALGEKITKEYDSLGRLIKTTDARGIITLTDYDAFGRITKVTQAAGTADEAITTFEYDANGNKIKETKALGLVTTFQYDKRNLLDKETFIGQNGLADVIFKYEYDTNGQLRKAIDPKNNATVYSYDKLGRKISETDHEGNTVIFEYDKVGNLISQTTPEGNKILHVYNPLRKRAWTTIDNKTKYFSYDSMGHLIRETDFNGIPTTYSYYYDRVETKIEGQGTTQERTTLFGHDPNMNMVIMLWPGVNKRLVFEYDLLNRRISEKDADQTIKRFSYDSSGNIIKITKRDNEVIDQKFDNLNRLIEVRASGVLQQQFAYDKLSRMTKAVDYNSGRKTHTVNYEYDCFNRVTNEIQDDNRLIKQYDANSNVTKLIYPSNRIIDKTYTPLNLVKDIWHQNTKIASLTYNKDAQIKSTALGNGIFHELSYNNQGLENMRDYRTQGFVRIYNMNTVYDPEGNALQETIAKTNETIIKNYSYDSLNRVTQESTAAYQNTWGYDPYNNLTSTNQNGSQETRSVNYDNEYTQINFNPVTYDASGNLTAYTSLPSSTSREYTYDWANRLIEAKQAGATLATYTYDALNRRVTKYTSTDAKTTTFVHDNNQVIEEYSSTLSSSPDKLYVYANYIDDPLMMESAGERFYYLKDRQFNITALTNAQGEVVERYDYNAFGLMTVTNANGVPQPKTAIGNYYGYTGRYFDTETGLWYYRNRMYSPELNRFLQRDPSGYVDGINLYAYVQNNPLRYLDPMGLIKRESYSWWSSVTKIFKDLLVSDYTSESAQPKKTEEATRRGNTSQLSAEQKLKIISGAALTAADTYGDIAVTGYDTVELIKNPTLKNLGTVGLDTVAAFTPLVSTTAIKAGAKFINEVAPGGKVAANITDDAFVRIDPTRFDKSIDNIGLVKEISNDGKVWITKYGDIKNVTKAQDFETMLYRKELWSDASGKFSGGATIRVVQNADDAVAAGVTNMNNKVRQWRLLRDVPADNLEILRRIE